MRRMRSRMRRRTVSDADDEWGCVGVEGAAGVDAEAERVCYRAAATGAVDVIRR